MRTDRSRPSRDDLQAALDRVLLGVPADGIAIGAARGSRTASACRGILAGQPVGPDTPFYAASVTKQVIAALVGRSALAGQLSVDDPVRRWLPELPRWLAPVRLRHLLHHTADLPEVTRPQPRPAADNREVLDRLVRTHPVPTPSPGVRFRYSNTGYVLLAEVVARVTRQPVGPLAEETLLRPLGLTWTRLGGEPVRLPGVPDPPGTVGDGGLWTSASDLTRWLVALNHGTPGPALVRLLESPGQLDDGAALDYAWGLRVVPTPRGRRVTHGGSWDTWLAKTVRLPERQVAVAVLSVGSQEDAISDAGLRLATLLASG